MKLGSGGFVQFADFDARSAEGFGLEPELILKCVRAEHDSDGRVGRAGILRERNDWQAPGGGMGGKAGVVIDEADDAVAGGFPEMLF